VKRRYSASNFPHIFVLKAFAFLDVYAMKERGGPVSDFPARLIFDVTRNSVRNGVNILFHAFHFASPF